MSDTESNFPLAMPSPPSSPPSSVTHVPGESPHHHRTKTKTTKKKYQTSPFPPPPLRWGDAHMMGVLQLKFQMLRNEMALFFIFHFCYLHISTYQGPLRSTHHNSSLFLDFSAVETYKMLKMGSSDSVNKRKKGRREHS